MKAIPWIREEHKPLVRAAKLDTNGFTIGKEYKIARESGSGYIVYNDNGHERFIMPDCDSGHIVVRLHPGLGYPTQKPVGYFQIISDCQEGE